MNPFLEFRRLVQGSRIVTTGAVVEVDGQTIRVRTRAGVIDARAVDSTLYIAGDEVLLREGLIQGKVRALSTVPIYNV